MEKDADEIQKQVTDWFDITYQTRKYKYLRPSEAYEVFISFLRPGPDKKLLDVACGPGMLLKHAIQKGINAYGIDISEKAIELCRKYVPQAITEVANSENLPFADDEFDYITCLGSLERFINIDLSLFEMKRVAKKDAVYCLIVRNSNTLVWRVYRILMRQKNRKAHMDAKGLKEWTELFINNGFDIISKYPDQWPGFRLMKWIFFWKTIDYTKIHPTILPIKYSNEFIFLLKKRI